MRLYCVNWFPSGRIRTATTRRALHSYETMDRFRYISNDSTNPSGAPGDKTFFPFLFWFKQDSHANLSIGHWYILIAAHQNKMKKAVICKKQKSFAGHNHFNDSGQEILGS